MSGQAREAHAYFDEDAVIAAIDLAGRCGAERCDIGFLHDDVPSDKAGWYAVALFKGARITAEDHRGPVEASDALARRLLSGGARCIGCGKPIVLSGRQGCRWRRMAERWEPGCGGRK